MGTKRSLAAVLALLLLGCNRETATTPKKDLGGVDAASPPDLSLTDDLAVEGPDMAPSCPPGGFHPATHHVAGADSQVMAYGDFNGDGAVDVVVPSNFNKIVSTLLGDGKGGFQQKVGFAGGGLGGIAAADFDGDKKLDVAVIPVLGPYEVRLLLGNGDGTFRLGATTLPDGYGVSNLIAVDLNSDGKQDLVVLNVMSGATVWLGKGDGTFTRGQSIPLVVGTNAAIAADLDHDGKLDLAFSELQSNTISVARGDGAGGFGQAAIYNAGTNPIGLIAVDIDGDGDLDLAVTNQNDDNVDVFPNLGKGTFGPPIHTPVGDAPRTLRSVDVDGDHKIDLVVANVLGGTLSVLLGHGDGTFAPKVDIPVDDNNYIGALVDLNGDGALDLVFVSPTTDRVSVLLGCDAGGR